MLQDKPVQEITSEILAHLENIQEKLETVWGKTEFERFRLSGSTVQNLDPLVKDALRKEIDEQEFTTLAESPVDALPEEVKGNLEKLLGRRVQNQIHRHILLSVISELWVEYLTRVDALRVSIGLEAYAQRDPLVQYKGQASEMFKNLLSDIRAGIISRMFLYQPRRQAAQTAEKPLVTSSTPVPPASEEKPAGSGKKKRKRH